MVFSILETRFESIGWRPNTRDDYTLLIVESASSQGRSTGYRSGEEKTMSLLCNLYYAGENRGNTIPYPGEERRLA